MVLIAIRNDGRLVPCKQEDRDPNKVMLLRLQRVDGNHSGSDSRDAQQNDTQANRVLDPSDSATSPRLYNLHDLRNVDENKMKAAEQKVKAGGQVTATEIGHAAAVATIKYSVTATAAGSGRRPSDALTTVSRNAGALFDQKQARGEVSGGGDRQAAIYTAATDIAGLLLRYEEADEDIAEIAHRVM